MDYNSLSLEFEQEKETSFKSYQDIIFNILANFIISMEIPPNTLLRESHLAKYLNISRTPVREALNKLEESDFVKYLPHQGYIVSEIHLSEFVDLSLLRSAIECVAAQQAASRATNKDLLLLKNALDNMKSSQMSNSLNKDINNFVFLESQFHNILCTISHNNYLIKQHNLIAPQLLHLRYFYAFKQNTNLESPLMLSIYEEHLIIYLAIKSKNPKLAYEAVREHINRLLQGILAN
jgi:DNA-binding GntR family transcriptional regulator